MTSFLSHTRAPALISLILGMISLPAASETLTDSRQLDPNSRMASYLYSDDMHRVLYDYAVWNDQRFGIACNADHNIQIRGINVIQPISLPNDAEVPVSGVWSYRFDAVRCDRTKTYNMLLVADESDQNHAYGLDPGETFTDMTLGRDVKPALMAVTSQHISQTCDDLDIFDTRIDEVPAQFPGPWSETWTVFGCGKLVEVPITFTPSPQGGTDWNIDTDLVKAIN